MKNSDNIEKNRLLLYIGMVDFAVIELNEFLDTHPECQEALEYFNYYNQLKNNALEEYAKLYGPLTIRDACNCGNEWKWVTQPWPWEGVC